MGTQTVIHFSDYGGPYRGNFIASLVYLHNILKLFNWRQVLVFSDIAKNKPWVESLASLEIPIYFISKKSRIKLTRDIYEIVNQENAQILHTHFGTFDFPAWVVKRLRILNNYSCEVIWHVHSPSERPPFIANRFKDAIRFSIAKDLYKIVVSVGGLQNLLKRGLSVNKTFVISNGIDLEHVIQTSETRDAMCRQLFLNNDGPILLQLGWDPIGKGVDISLKAVENLVSNGLKVKLLLVGTERLHQYVHDLYGSDPPPWLKLLPFTEHIANYFQVADVFVSASRAEGFPYSVGEAMYYGLPVIASDIRGLEWAHSSPGVVFFHNKDVTGLTNAIFDVHNWSIDKREILITANRELIKNRHSINSWGNQIVDLYNKIISL